MDPYHEAVARLLSLNNLVAKPYTASKKELRASLKRMRSFLDHLGSPDKKMQIIHVAGTSGKGSVAAIIRSILQEDGRTVASYTSPHTTTYLERFTIGDKLMDPNNLVKAVETVLDHYTTFLKKDPSPLSFFELSTATALFAFADQGVKWCVLETGCGGRFDATNVIGTPRAAVITNIGKDHTHILGSSLTDIARAKAGIIKKNGIVFCGEMRPAIRKVFMKEAIKHSAALFFVHPPYQDLLAPELGAHQQHNAALAAAVAEELSIDQTTIQKAFSNIQLPPCRFETMQDNPRVIIDGAHSPVKIKALCKQLESIGGPVHILFGATATKDSKPMIEQLAKHADRISATRFTTTFRKAANPFELIKLVGKKKRGDVHLNPFEALSVALDHTKKNETLIITGSLYLCGELREYWIAESEIAKKRSSR